MRVILIRDIQGTGRKGDLKDLSDGYVRNFLIPRGLVRPATSDLIAAHVRERAHEEEQRRERTAELQRAAHALPGITLSFLRKAAPNGELFGSVTAEDIAQELAARGYRRIQVQLDHPLKMLGTSSVPLDLSEGIRSTIGVTIEPEL